MTHFFLAMCGNQLFTILYPACNCLELANFKKPYPDFVKTNETHRKPLHSCYWSHILITGKIMEATWFCDFHSKKSATCNCLELHVLKRD